MSTNFYIQADDGNSLNLSLVLEATNVFIQCVAIAPVSKTVYHICINQVASTIVIAMPVYTLTHTSVILTQLLIITKLRQLEYSHLSIRTLLRYKYSNVLCQRQYSLNYFLYWLLASRVAILFKLLLSSESLLLLVDKVTYIKAHNKNTRPMPSVNK